MLEFINISKKYAGHAALDDLSFSLPDGDFVFLVGPSGAGKTTVLKLILRDIDPTYGKVMLDGVDIARLKSSKLPAHRRNIGMIFQDFKILTDRTVGENIALTLEIRNLANRDINTRVEGILKLVGLTNKKNFFPSELSAGELQRVAIARAIIGSPKILLADEPTGNLDPKTGWEILRILNEVNKTGTTILMATHNFDIVNSMKKRVIALKAGRLVKDVKKGTYT